MGLRYRVKQFLRTLRDKPSQTDLDLVHKHLPAELLPLFERMPAPDQAHSIRVCQTLIDNDHTDPELLAAALLHDVGKCLQTPNIFERVMVVLANQIAPGRVLRWSEGKAEGWRRAFVIAHNHPDWGADLVEKHGGSDVTVQLIRHHQVSTVSLDNDTIADQLSLLQAADSEN